MNILGQLETTIALVGAVCLVLGAGVAYGIQKVISRIKARSLDEEYRAKVGGAKREAENIIKSAQLDAAA